MIITKLQGGLGNQMFQYAMGRNLAYKDNTILKLDLSSYRQKNEVRNYSLGNFNIVENIATDEEIKKIKKYEFKNNKKYFFHNLFFADNSIYIEESKFKTKKNKKRNLKNNYLDGHWQNEKYFKEIENIIREEFTLKIKLNNNIKKQIINNNSISLHVRRTDYIETKKDVYHSCSLGYYNKAIKKISEKISNPHFFIFSDDLKWCKKNLIIKFPITFIENTKDYEELILMSKCKHNIIANSTFSWWAAWLNQNTNKIIISPQKWFIKPNKDTIDLLPNCWLRI